jgi:hypothetical protein
MNFKHLLAALERKTRDVFSGIAVLRFSQLSANECIWHIHLFPFGGGWVFVKIRIVHSYIMNWELLFYCILWPKNVAWIWTHGPQLYQSTVHKGYHSLLQQTKECQQKITRMPQISTYSLTLKGS